MESLRVLGDRLEHLHTQDFLLLFLYHSLAIPRLSYILRTSPCFLSSDIQAFEDLFKSITGSITNNSLHISDSTWTQASLPVKHGGLCIRSAAQLALSSFLASVAGPATLVAQIIPTHLEQFPIVARDEALSCWSQRHNNPPPPDSVSDSQREWDSPRVKASSQALLEDTPDASSRARLLAAGRKESGAWLNALPISILGLRMDDKIARIAVGLRLGTSLCCPHECSITVEGSGNAWPQLPFQ